MKRIAVLLAFGLAGCAIIPGPSPKQIMSDAQKKAVEYCGYLATAATVADIFLSTNATYQTAEWIGKAICNAVTINPLADGPGAKNYKPHVNGVLVRGTFIK